MKSGIFETKFIGRWKKAGRFGLHPWIGQHCTIEFDGKDTLWEVSFLYTDNSLLTTFEKLPIFLGRNITRLEDGRSCVLMPHGMVMGATPSPYVRINPEWLLHLWDEGSPCHERISSQAAIDFAVYDKTGIEKTLYETACRQKKIVAAPPKNCIYAWLPTALRMSRLMCKSWESWRICAQKAREATAEQRLHKRPKTKHDWARWCGYKIGLKVSVGLDLPNGEIVDARHALRKTAVPYKFRQTAALTVAYEDNVGEVEVFPEHIQAVIENQSHEQSGAKIQCRDIVRSSWNAAM